MKKILLAVFLLALLVLASADNKYTQYLRLQNTYGMDKVAFSDDEKIVILYSNNNENLYLYRSYDMKLTATAKWQSIPSYLQTFSFAQYQNAMLIASDGGEIFQRNFSAHGDSSQLKLCTLQDCKLSRVSPSPDGKLFAALCEDNKLVIGDLLKGSADVETVIVDFTVQAFRWHPLYNKLAVSGTKKDDGSLHLEIYDSDKKQSTPVVATFQDKIKDLEFSSDGKLLAYTQQDSTDHELVKIINLESPEQQPSILIAPEASQLLELKRSGLLLTAYDAQRSYVWEFKRDSYGNYDSILKRTGLSTTGEYLFTIDRLSKEVIMSKICSLANQVFLNAALQCVDCLSPCASCFGNQVKCSSCKDSYYLNEDTYACTACIPNCKVCDVTSCKTCLDGFYLDANRCESCVGPFIGCLTCTSDACNKCDEANNWILNIKNQCECKPKYTKIGDQCIQCPLHCSVCTRADTCQVCDTTEHRKPTPVDGKCLCDSGFFQNPLSGDCDSCILGCSICDNKATCSGCDTKKHWILKQDTKTCGCQANYLQVVDQCISCGELITGCLACQKVDTCSSCMDGFDLDATTHHCTVHPQDDGVNVIVVVVVGVCILLGLAAGSYFIVKMIRKRRGKKVQTLLESEAENQQEELR